MFPVVSIVNMNDEEWIRVFPYKPVIEWEQLNYLTSDWDIELMQFTWLTNKNWVEIFEWDVLKTNEHIDSVVWRDDLCWFSYKNDSSRMNLSDWIEHWKYSWTEIIWNIYQNPEILTN